MALMTMLVKIIGDERHCISLNFTEKIPDRFDTILNVNLQYLYPHFSHNVAYEILTYRMLEHQTKEFHNDQRNKPDFAEQYLILFWAAKHVEL